MPLTDDDFNQLLSFRSLRAFVDVIKEIINDPSRDLDSFEDKLKEAIDAQRIVRDTNAITKLISDSGLKFCADSLERFEAGTSRGVTQDRINRLAECDWVDYGQNIVILGATGTGKSFLAKSLAIAACRKKYSTLYFRLSELADSFDEVATNPTQRKELMNKLVKPAVVVIDDFLATDVSDNALAQIFNLLVERENSSTVLASQRQPEYWYDVFNDQAVADAALSRLANHGIKLELKGDDMRKREDLREERNTHNKQTRSCQPKKR